MYPASELVLNNLNQVYHLGILPEHVSDTIILVGDQDRVAMISSFFDTLDHTSQHREFVCHTGTYNSKRITVISTGIGTDNIDITVNELDALVNIDLQTRTDKNDKKSLKIVRIGTCGILQPEIPVHSYILSTGALGLDNIAHFYDVDFSEQEKKIADELTNFIQLPTAISPYFIESDPALNQLLASEKTHTGITVTSSGFYGPQGRQLRLGTRTTQLNDRLTAFRSSENQKVYNFEMESSAIFALGRSLGHACTTICLGVANRPKMEFSKGYEQEMRGLIVYVLDRISQ